MDKKEKNLIVEALEYLYNNYLEADQLSEVKLKMTNIQRLIAKIKGEFYIDINQ